MANASGAIRQVAQLRLFHKVFHPGTMTHNANRHNPEEIKSLLTRALVIRNACELDLLVFLHRHPRSLLTNEQLAAFVGYDMKLVAKAIEGFIEAELLARTQNPKHAARMYLLLLQGPKGGGLKSLLAIASTRPGRQAILEQLDSGRSREPVDIARGRRRLHAIA